ncbi:cell division protein SepF [Candidatus Bathyarchaeota archaeon]|nr:cell division protein SepF [Candidatus Bathyarchaeota archaeon]
MQAQSTCSVKTVIYVKAIALRYLSDIEKIRKEMKNGNILIVKITPLAKKSINEVKEAVMQLKNYVSKEGGDIARLGEERIIITPPKIKIWREKT